MQTHLIYKNIFKFILLIFLLISEYSFCQATQNLSETSNLTLIGVYNTEGYAKDVFIRDNLAYVADDSSGLRIIDVSNPELPIEVGHLVTGGSSSDIFLDDSYAYIAEGYSDIVFSIVDINNPTNPTKVSSVNRDSENLVLIDGTAIGIAVSNGFVYIADYSGRMHQFDISSLENPQLTAARLNSEGYSSGVCIPNNLLFFTDPIRMYIYDISQPNSPFVIRTHTLWSVNNSDLAELPIQVMGNYAYVANGWPGMRIIDISIPESTTQTSLTYVSGGAKNLFVTGDYAYISTLYTNSLRVLDISDPSSPVEVGYAETSSTPEGVFAQKNYVYLACGANGLLIYRNDLISDVNDEQLFLKDFILEQNYPNPFNPSTTIKYQIPNDGMVSLKIYDITGQEVKTLVTQAQSKGRYEVSFYASNLSSGVYFYRIESGSFTKTMKMLLLK